ncbi:MAG: cytochrome c4 [Rhodocyclaceae bacterium]|nr:cytochrome c4 [Rhodocyclaceae bacterium]
MMNRLVLWMACLTLATPAYANKLSAKAKEVLTMRCALCHGLEGESATAIYPRLAAQHREYLRKQLIDFREGRRQSDTMNEMAKDLDDAVIAELADYYASKPALASRVLDADLAAVGKYIYHKGNAFSGVPACASCHGEKGEGTAQLPRLAGQHPRYIETQLLEFNKRLRNNDNAVMHTIAAKLTALETHAVAAYLGGLK